MDGVGGLVVLGRRVCSRVGVRGIEMDNNVEVQVIVMGGKFLKRVDHVVEKDRMILAVIRSVVVGMDLV